MLKMFIPNLWYHHIEFSVSAAKIGIMIEFMKNISIGVDGLILVIATKKRKMFMYFETFFFHLVRKKFIKLGIGTQQSWNLV